MSEMKASEMVLRPLTEAEVKARKGRNLWLALSLLAFVLLVLAITIVRLGPDVMNRDL
jgi:hypothetical protein